MQFGGGYKRRTNIITIRPLSTISTRGQKKKKRVCEIGIHLASSDVICSHFKYLGETKNELNGEMSTIKNGGEIIIINDKMPEKGSSALGPLIGGVVEDARFKAAPRQRLQSVVAAAYESLARPTAPRGRHRHIPARHVRALAGPSGVNVGGRMSIRRSRTVRPLRFSRPADEQKRKKSVDSSKTYAPLTPQKNISRCHLLFTFYHLRQRLSHRI